MPRPKDEGCGQNMTAPFKNAERKDPKGLPVYAMSCTKNAGI